MWTYKETFSVGGLFNIGFIPGTDILHILSAQGESLIDCENGIRVAREHNHMSWANRIDEATGEIEGFHVFAGQKYFTAGIYGNNFLPGNQMSKWRLMERMSNNPDLLSGCTEYLLTSLEDTQQILVADDSTCEYRANGFSSTGHAFAIAFSCEVVIYIWKAIET